MKTPRIAVAPFGGAWRRRRRVLLAVLALMPTSVMRPCTTLFLQHGDQKLVANNYDYYVVDGRVIVNRRGLRKTVFSTNSGLQWVSRFGSVTLNQWGHEFPNGGLNEAGLVVEQMMLEGSQFPSDARPSITEMQWIQYQLDCSASVAEVLASDARIRIDPGSTPIHFLVADASGDAAVIEFLGGRMVAHTGDSLPFAALTNNTYDDSVAFAATTTPGAASHTSSLGRFVHAAASALDFAQKGANDPVAYAFAALENVTQPNWTRWNAVFDLAARRVYFRTQIARTVKYVALDDVDFRPRAQTRMMDINSTAEGAVVPDELYTSADNLTVLTSVFRQTPPYAGVAYSYLVQRAAYPDSAVATLPPLFLAHPGSLTVTPGARAVLSATVTGDAPLSYQWTKDGDAIPGATDDTLAFSNVDVAHAAYYAVVASNEAGVATSRFARLVVAAPDPGRLVNMSVRAAAGVGGQPLIVGLVVGGGAKCVLVRAIGPSLGTLFGLPGVLADSRLEVHQKVAEVDHVVGTNDNWGADAVECDVLTRLCASVGAFPLATASRDAALAIDIDGARTVQVAGVPVDTSGIVLVEAYDVGTGNSPRLVNISTRNQVGTGADVLVAGFVISGNVPTRLLVRGIGPSLATGFGVAGALVDPQLELHAKINGRDTIVATNDNWADEPGAADAGASVGAFPLPATSKDAALLVTLPAGTYTAVLRGAHATSGNGMVEVYEVR
jgi:choloylglycine hydrolase